MSYGGIDLLTNRFNELTMKIPAGGSFTLKGGDTSFAGRQKDLFDKLSQAEKACNKEQPTTDYPEIDQMRFRRPPPPGKRRRSETRQFKGKESIFKRPDLPSPFPDRPLPGYAKHPEKWTRYTLDDVSEDDMSDARNTQTALSFLNELRARRLKEAKKNGDMEVDEETANDNPSTSRVSFRRPFGKNIPRTMAVEDKEEKPVFRGSKIILPEYVIGQKVQKKVKKERCVEKVDKSKELKLQHLEEDVDDDE